MKVQGLEAGVNITVGLPVIRTSVDHGTAFSISGTGKADPASMIEPMRQAIELRTALIFPRTHQRADQHQRQRLSAHNHSAKALGRPDGCAPADCRHHVTSH